MSLSGMQDRLLCMHTMPAFCNAAAPSAGMRPHAWRGGGRQGHGGPARPLTPRPPAPRASHAHQLAQGSENSKRTRTVVAQRDTNLCLLRHDHMQRLVAQCPRPGGRHHPPMGHDIDNDKI